MGYLDQPRFLNGAAALETDLPPRELLDLLLAVEARFGRDRAAVPAQGPRTLDLDLLLYGDAGDRRAGPPGPAPPAARAGLRPRPLAEVAPGLEVPGKGSVQALLARLH